MNTNIKRLFATTLVLIIMLCIFTACGAPPEKVILGKWYNVDGDCLEILSDNTYSIKQVSDYIYESGLGSGKWTYLEEEGFFKFYANNYDEDIIKVEINKDEKGTYIDYTYYGTFYKK